MGKIGMREREANRRIVEMRNREVGALAPRSFFRSAAASLDIVLRLGIHKKLDKHRGCVNTVSFNATGNILVSGSNDRMVMLWDWEMGLVKLSFHSGHMDNVFQAKFMPYTDDSTMVTCAADGEVRMAKLQDGGHVFTKELAKHEGRAHKMAVEPGSPHIVYSCGEDGLVYHFDLRIHTATKLFKCKSFNNKLATAPIVQLYAIAIDPRNPNCFAIAGSDQFTRVFDIRNCWWDGKSCVSPADCFCPPHLIDDNRAGITGLAFSDQSELLASYTFEAIYLFSKGQGLDPNLDSVIPSSSMEVDASEQTFTGAPNELVQTYSGHRNCKIVKGVGFLGPNCDYVTSGSDTGRVFIWRKKGGQLVRVMEGGKRVVNCIEPNPCVTMLAGCGMEKDIKIWMPNTKEAGPLDKEEIMKLHFIRDGFDYDFDDYFGEDDGDNLDIDVMSDHEFNVHDDSDFNDESEEDGYDDDDDDDGADDDNDDDYNGYYVNDVMMISCDTK